MAKRSYGFGGLEEIEEGKKYRITVWGGKDPSTGKYRRHRETFHGTRRQAKRRAEQLRREFEDGLSFDTGKMTFGEWLTHYIGNRESAGKVRPATLKCDRTIGKHLERGLGAVRMTDITPLMVVGFYNSLRDSGVGDTTIYQCHRMLKAVLKEAVNCEVIARNPVERVEAPKKPKPKRHALTIEDAEKIRRICSTGTPTAQETAVYLGLAVGGRLGEILGLTWSHIVLDNGRSFVHIIQQFTKDGEITPTKTDHSDMPVGRIVPIDEQTVKHLAAWKLEQRRTLNMLGIEQTANTPVITNTVGGFLDHHNFERWFRLFSIEHGFGAWYSDDGRKIIELNIGDDASLYPGCIIQWRDSGGWPCDSEGRRYSRSYKRPEVKRHYKGLVFHELRHSNFTMRLASGTDITTCQYLGGWNSPAMLLNTYAHPVSQNVWNSANFMDVLKDKNGV